MKACDLGHLFMGNFCPELCFLLSYLWNRAIEHYSSQISPENIRFCQQLSSDHSVLGLFSFKTNGSDLAQRPFWEVGLYRLLYRSRMCVCNFTGSRISVTSGFLPSRIVRCVFHRSEGPVVCSLARVAITSYRKVDGLKQQKLILSVWGSEVWNQSISKVVHVSSGLEIILPGLFQHLGGPGVASGCVTPSLPPWSHGLFH